jgi:hypothetical protein
MQPAGRTLVRSAGFIAAPLVGVPLLLSVVGSYSPDQSLLLAFLFAFLGIIAAAVLLVGLILAARRRQWHRIWFAFSGQGLTSRFHIRTFCT